MNSDDYVEFLSEHKFTNDEREEFQNRVIKHGNLTKMFNTKNSIRIFMGKFGTIKEIFELFILKRKFYMFPILILLIAMMGLTALAQSGLVAFIYPI